jgi:hypothetical protein
MVGTRILISEFRKEQLSVKLLTLYGFGEGQWPAADTEMRVMLDIPCRGQTEIVTNKRESVRWGEFGVARVINAAGMGIASNLQFYEALGDAEEEVLRRPSPFDETRFLLNLAQGSFMANRVLGPAVGSIFAINPWIDRWAPERTEPFADEQSAIRAFSRKGTQVAGASGISSSILLDGKKKKIIHAIIFARTGVVFDRRFS